MCGRAGGRRLSTGTLTQARLGSAGLGMRCYVSTELLKVGAGRSGGTDHVTFSGRHNEEKDALTWRFVICRQWRSSSGCQVTPLPTTGGPSARLSVFSPVQARYPTSWGRGGARCPERRSPVSSAAAAEGRERLRDAQRSLRDAQGLASLQLSRSAPRSSLQLAATGNTRTGTDEDWVCRARHPIPLSARAAATRARRRARSSPHHPRRG